MPSRLCATEQWLTIVPWDDGTIASGCVSFSGFKTVFTFFPFNRANRSKLIVNLFLDSENEMQNSYLDSTFRIRAFTTKRNRNMILSFFWSRRYCLFLFLKDVSWKSTITGKILFIIAISNYLNTDSNELNNRSKCAISSPNRLYGRRFIIS